MNALGKQEKKRKHVRWVGTGLIAGLFLVFILLGLELFFRFQPRFARSVLAFDQHTLWRLKSNHKVKKLYGQGEQQTHFKLGLNKQGFRGANFRKKKQEGITRIMILGDSYTAGLDYPFEEIFSARLEQQLNINQAKQFEVLNASCPAWGLDQAFLYWQNEGRLYQSDYLVLMVAPNDLREAYNKKLLVLNGKGDLQHNKIKISWPKQLSWNLATKSSLYQYLQQQVFLTKHGNFFDIYETYPVHFGKRDSINWDLPIFLKEPFEEVLTSEALFIAIIKAVNQSCKAAGSQLILSVIPSKMEFDATLSDTIYQPGKVAQLLENIAIKENILFLNLFEKLNADTNPLRIYIQNEFHLNSQGHQFVADHLSVFVHQFDQ